MLSLSLTQILLALCVVLASRYILMPLFFRDRIDYSGKVRPSLPTASTVWPYLTP